MAMTFHSDYMTHVHEPDWKILSQAASFLEHVEYDTLIGTGLSGALVVPMIARDLGKHWAVVRKPNDGSHSPDRAEGTIGERWVFVDDLVASGTTRNRVIDTVKAITGGRTQFVGSYLYNAGGRFSPHARMRPLSSRPPR